jgi:hypothetical protein
MHAFAQGAAPNQGPPNRAAKTDQFQTLPLDFAQKSFPDATIGVLFRSSVQAIGGSGMYELSVTGDLPPGMIVETGSDTVAVSGVPSETGEYQLQINVADFDGNTLRRDFTIHVYPQVPGSRARINPVVTDNETFNFTDAEDVFFPVVISDNENFTFTDSVARMDAVVIVDNERFTFTDTETGMDAAVLVDRENITLTDKVGGEDSALAPDTEHITLTDAVSAQIFDLPSITWATPAPITYPTALSATQLDASSSVAGSFAYTPPAGTVLSPGISTLSVTLTPTNLTLYTTATATVQQTVNLAAPAFSPPAGIYTSAQSVSITDTWPGATIYYTTNGTAPTIGSPVYSGPLSVSATETLEAMAMASGAPNIPVATAIYTIATPAALTTPTPGSTLSGASVAFSWTPGNTATHFELWLGTTGVGSSNLYNSGNVMVTTETVSGLPGNGETVYARLYWLINGTWNSADYTYTASGAPTPAALTTPTPGATLEGTAVAFSWTPGNTATHFELWLGTTGVGSSNLYNSGNVTVTTETVSGLPSNGETVYARLYWLINGTWNSADYTYTASGAPTPAALTTPTPGTQLAGTSQAFTWTPGNTATHFELWLGTTGVGSSNLYNSGNVTVTTETVSGLPSNGETVYARLYYLINSTWNSADYTYTASGSPTPAVLTTPTPGTQLLGTSVAFSWTPGNTATHFELWLGTTGVGSSDLYNSGNVTATTETVTGLPSNGETVYARFYWLINSTWNSADYTYTASGSPTPAAITFPTQGSTLSGTSVAFTWTPGNTATHFELWLGTTGVGSSNLYNSGNVTVTTETVSGLPSNGQPVYARLYYLINGTWQPVDYTYTASGSPTPAALTTPTPGSVLPGPSVTFAWNPGNTAIHFELWLGISGPGSSNLYNSGNVTATSETVGGMPVNGTTVYARLYYLINGTWQYADYTYTAATEVIGIGSGGPS